MNGETETAETRRHNRYRREKQAIREVENPRDVLVDVVGALYTTLSDMDAVPEGLHPADIITKHIQRGNMDGDGVDICGRGEVERLTRELDEARRRLERVHSALAEAVPIVEQEHFKAFDMQCDHDEYCWCDAEAKSIVRRDRILAAYQEHTEPDR